jgi:hypothetical protein
MEAQVQPDQQARRVTMAQPVQSAQQAQPVLMEPQAQPDQPDHKAFQA